MKQVDGRVDRFSSEKYMTSRHDVTFVIPTRDECECIGECIVAIQRSMENCANTNSQIVVVDNGSIDNTVDIAKGLGATILEYPDKSISALRNAGVAATSASFIGFIDADVIVSKDWLTNAMNAFENDEIAMVGCSPLIPENSTWVTRAWNLHVKLRANRGYRQWLASMNILVRRSYFDEIGGFDEKLHTCEDVDLGYRLSKKYLLLNDKTIKAVHLGEASTLYGLYKKESWRGQANYMGAFNHGLTLREIPSLVHPLLTITSILGLFISLIASNLAFSMFFLVMLLFYPVTKSILVTINSRSAVNFPSQLAVWTVYALARARSLKNEAMMYFRDLFSR